VNPCPAEIHTHVGESATTPGLSPGNVISGNGGHGVSIDFSDEVGDA